MRPHDPNFAAARVDLSDLLVVVLPGIGGSRLGASPDDVVWDVDGPRMFDALRHPDQLALDRELMPLGLIDSWKPFGLFTKIEGYDRLIRRLSDLPGAVVDAGRYGLDARDLDANVVAVGYDFRWGVRSAADQIDEVLQRYLQHRWPTGGRAKVVFVAHSMGGLVAAEWLRRDENYAWCRDLITLGTPFQGSMVALDALAQGVRVKGPFRIRGKVLALLRSWPAIYDLLPTGLSVDNEAGATKLDAHELELPWDGDLARASKDLHQRLTDETAWQRTLRPFAGHGQKTLMSALWKCGAVSCAAASPSAEGTGWDITVGDGTVASHRSFPAGYGVGGSNFAPSEFSKHGPLAFWDSPAGMVGDAARFPLVEGAGDPPPVVALDVDELVCLGDTARVEVRPPAQARAVGEAAVVITEQSSRKPRLVRLSPEEGGLVADVGDLGVGVYSVVSTWRLGKQELTTRASVQVVDPNEVGVEDE